MFKVNALLLPHLDPVSFSVAAGEIVAVRAPSGMGKTLLLRALADLDERPGDVMLNGRARQSFSGPHWRRHVRFFAAEPGWWADMVREHFPPLSDAALSERMTGLMAKLDLSPALLDQPVARLSTGERQRFALIRGLLDQPDILLLDEPTAALDTAVAMKLVEILKQQAREKRGIILTTHDDRIVAALKARTLDLARYRHH